MISFEEVLRQLGAQWSGDLPTFSDVVDDSREVVEGSLFVLRRGAEDLDVTQALRFCAVAIERGAAAVIAEPSLLKVLSLPKGRVGIALSEPHLHLQALAEGFYGNPSKDMAFIAVTGTNGKTTTTYLIEGLAKALGLKIGILGTISHRYPGYEETSINTTPGCLKLYRLLRAMASASCDMVAMEVSSHAIAMGRIEGLLFDVAVWNNLGTDHLDFHHTREAYAEAKRKLFSEYLPKAYAFGKKPIAVFNVDDSAVIENFASLDPNDWGGGVASYSIEGVSAASLRLTHLAWKEGHWSALVHYKETSQDLGLTLVGRYNLSNAAAALSALIALGYAPEALFSALIGVPQVPGRMQRVHYKPEVIVDFAHTPEALESAIRAARDAMPAAGRLIAVFGAGGDRDASKRPQMAEISSRLSDLTIVTSDNPRTEDPRAIIEDVLAGLSADAAFEAIVDRHQAIARALSLAQKKDCVIIAGKGHEKTQTLGTEVFPFDDVAEVKKFFEKQYNLA